MSGYELHPEAVADPDDIREHIAEDNPDEADRLITENLRRNVNGVGENPFQIFHQHRPLAHGRHADFPA